MVASQAERGVLVTPFSEAIRVGHFMMLDPPTFTGVKVEEDPQGFLYEVEKIFCVIHATNVEGVEFASYQLQDVTYQWYEEWDRARGDVEESSLWENFSNAFWTASFLKS